MKGYPHTGGACSRTPRERKSAETIRADAGWHIRRRRHRREGDGEYGRQRRIPKAMRQLHDGTVVIVIALMVMDHLMPAGVDRECQARATLHDDDGRDQRVESLEDVSAETHSVGLT